jgi:hypothetical protein
LKASFDIFTTDCGIPQIRNIYVTRTQSAGSIARCDGAGHWSIAAHDADHGADSGALTHKNIYKRQDVLTKGSFVL